MNKLILLGIAATLGAAKLAFFPANPPVDLQPTTPGTAQTGHLNISGTATVGVLRSNNTVFGQATAPTGISYGGFFTAASDQARGFYGYASSPTGLTYGGFFQNASDQGRAVFGLATSTSGNNYGGYFQSASAAGRGVFGVAASTTGTTYGVLGRTLSPTGFGVFSDGNLGVVNGSISGDGSGITNLNANSISGGTLAVGRLPVPLTLGGTSDTHIISGVNYSAVEGSCGVFGRSVASPGVTYGGYFMSGGSSGLGVYGFASAFSGSGIGVEGQSNSTSGRGVYGVSNRAAGTTYGVYGRTLSLSGFGVYSNGNFGASGTKSFRIDHPFDPENKYLLHYSAESPSPQNFYVGNVVTDSQGFAWVHLPSYFEEINKDFKYQLTVVGKSFARAVVWDEISGNRFRIRTDEPNVKVSWRVDAERNDLYIRNRPTRDVVEKQVLEKGKYQHPEFYGLGPERGMDYDPERVNRGNSQGLPE